MNLITNDFTAVSTDSDESLPDKIKPADASEYLSALKAVSALKSYPEDIIIGCDTTVICGDKILGKPKNREECRKSLELLSGRTHQVITGCTIICKNKRISSGTSQRTSRMIKPEVTVFRAKALFLLKKSTETTSMLSVCPFPGLILSLEILQINYKGAFL